jgi:hypothetical protein
VVGQLGQVLPGPLLVERLQGLAGLPVEAEPVPGRDLLVQTIADEAVAEAHPPQRAGDIDDHAGRFGFLENRQELFTGLPGEPFQRIQSELPAKDRGQREESDAFVRKAPQPAADRVADSVGDREV